MLKEEQAAELLRRCEAIAGRQLKQIRGNLRKASTRAEAVWELIVAEAAYQLGRVEYESEQGGPDVRLALPTGRWVSIEATYLHPRFEDEEQRSSMLVSWMHEAAASLGPNPPEIRCEFSGDDSHPAGPKRTLPREHDKKRFLASTEISTFLAEIAARPDAVHQLKLKDYSATLIASPRKPGSHGFLTWGGPLQEAPRVVDEHAAFRAVRTKLRQHKVNEPHIVCIGSDVSPALSSNMHGFGIRLEHALVAAVSKSGELSGLLIVNIEQSHSFGQGIVRFARSTAYPVSRCRYPLTEEEWEFIRRFDLNRWKYTFPLARKEVPPAHRHRNIPGSFVYSSTVGGNVKFTVPASVLAEVLAGQKQLLEDYGGPEENSNKHLMGCLRSGWAIVGCRYQAGDIQQAKAATVEIELAPPHEAVFWPRK